MNRVKLRTVTVGLVFGAASMTTFLAGCDRPETASSNATPSVTTTVGMEIDDTVITTKVKSALLNDQTVKGIDIKVATRKGVVLLSEIGRASCRERV